MSESKEELRSESITAEIKAAKERRDELQIRVETLAAEIERHREQLGRAMAGAATSASTPELRVKLRDAQEELDASERGLAYLATELQRLTAAKRTAQAEEAKVASDRALNVAVEAIDDLAEQLQTQLHSVLPLIERAQSATLDSVIADNRASKLTRERLPSATRVHQQGWAMHPRLDGVTAALRHYTCSPTDADTQDFD